MLIMDIKVLIKIFECHDVPKEEWGLISEPD